MDYFKNAGHREAEKYINTIETLGAKLTTGQLKELAKANRARAKKFDEQGLKSAAEYYNGRADAFEFISNLEV